MAVDPHVQVLRELLVADHEERIAEVQRWADEAGARQRRLLAHVARLRAIPYPWEREQTAA